MNGLAAARYVSYLLVGASDYLFFGASAGIAAGVGLFGLCLVFVSLLLGGYASGLSFIMPRVAALAALVIVVPFWFLGILDFFRGAIRADPLFVLPSAVVIAVSIFALLWSDGSVWRRPTTNFDKIEIAIIVGLPASFATWSLGAFLWWLIRAYHRAT
ncbi:MAG TPA: hypothetical protein VF397_06335 [Pyrinomonadaceae bacterium]